MNRDAVVLYLREVRDLEFAKSKIVQFYNLGKNAFEKEKQYLTVSQVPEVGDFEYKVRIPWPYVIGGFALCCTGAFSIGGLYLWYKAIKEYNENKKIAEDCDRSRKEAIEKYEKEMARIEGNRETYAVIAEQWNKKSEYWDREYRTVQSLLNDFYSMNILPEPYRNIQSVYYLYNYMSTSQESLSNAFLHERIENGIQRILAKLDQIVAQNEEIIFHQRIAEAQNQQIIEQNYEIISELEKSNKTTQEISKKLDVGNNYLRVNNYFAYATYLRQKNR